MDEKKTKAFYFRVSSKELSEMKQEAQKERKSLSQYIRETHTEHVRRKYERV